MDACPTCGAERRFEGTMFPARRLCPCESRSCHCGAPALVVEFQTRIKKKDPKLPKESNADVEFTCGEHAPDDFREDLVGRVEKSPPPERTVRRSRKSKTDLVDVPRSADRAGKRFDRPAETYAGPVNVDPAWGHPNPPPGARSSNKVVCYDCARVHLLRDRLMWNGTSSYCPNKKCNSGFFIEYMEDEQ